MLKQEDIEEFHDVMKHVMQRTGMYVYKDTFYHAAAYLQGYAHAQARHAQDNILKAFRNWLAKYFDYGSNIAWSGIITHFYPDDIKAKEKTLELFELFMKEFTTS